MEQRVKKLLFKDYLIRKILEGKKTQTRRIVKDSEKGVGRFLIGDILYVPEAFAKDENGKIHYRLDEPDATGLHWQASLFMPMRYARVWLEITRVDIQHVQDISEEDAAADAGLTPDPPYVSMHDSFADMFDGCYGEGAFEMNPLVWVVSFKRIKPPVEILVKRER